jgi:DNA-binding winged helix-turn-helix (wHTH) protein/tetratricopeptide (TPR) repeat protein
MALPTELRFGSCTVHAQRREVLRGGQLQDLPPKAFDLLLMLLRERHRAVAKSELVDALWQQQAVSDSVLARTLMKVRQAIGDPAARPVWIKTIHGFGYRFVGEVIELHPQGSAAAAASAAVRHEDGKPGVRQRRGGLPGDHQTGDASFDWTKLGLMALVGHALESDERLEVVPMQALLEALGRLPADALAQERVQQAQQALGLGWVVHASLRRQGSLLWLDYQLVAACGLTRGGSLRETEAVALGERFARAISAGLFPGEGAQLAFESRDPFVNQAFARAIELWSHHQLQSAATLFDMVCEREPGSLIAQLWRVRSLASLCQPAAAEAAGQALLAQAVERGDLRIQVMTHLHVGTGLVNSGDSAKAAVHYRQAQALVQALPDEWIGKVQMAMAYLAHSRYEVEEARRCYRAADAAFRAAGDPARMGHLQLHLAHIQMHLAILAELDGDLLDALQLAEEGLALLEAQRRHVYAASAQALLAPLHAALGRFDRARAMAESLLTRLESLQIPQVVVVCTASAARVFGEFGDVAAVEGVIALDERLTPGDLGPRVTGPKLEALCHRALWRGDLGRLRATAERATALWQQHAEAMLPSVLIVYLLQLRAEAAAGCFAEAAALRERILAHPLATVQVEVQAVLDRARAAEQLARGDADGALSTLLALIGRMALGREPARARIDAAWLLAEAGDTARAASLLGGAGSWRNEHPAGLATQARKAHANGEAGKARDLQQQALDRFRGTPPAAHLALLQAYAAPAAAGSPGLPRLARLATDSWLPPMRPAMDERFDA